MKWVLSSPNQTCLDNNNNNIKCNRFVSCQVDNNLTNSNKPGKYRQRSYDNLKTGKLSVQRVNDKRRCVLAKSPYLSKIHDENAHSNGKLRKMQRYQSNDIHRIFSPTDERTPFDHDDERINFIDSQTNLDRMPLSPTAHQMTTTTTTSTATTSSTSSSLSSSLASLSSPSLHLTPSHIKLKPTLIPTQYRVYIPQKKCEMKESYTDYVYCTDQQSTSSTLNITPNKLTQQWMFKAHTLTHSHPQNKTRTHTDREFMHWQWPCTHKFVWIVQLFQFVCVLFHTFITYI